MKRLLYGSKANVKRFRKSPLLRLITEESVANRSLSQAAFKRPDANSKGLQTDSLINRVLKSPKVAEIGFRYSRSPFDCKDDIANDVSVGKNFFSKDRLKKVTRGELILNNIREKMRSYQTNSN